jgi:FkbM family methyltransferase
MFDDDLEIFLWKYSPSLGDVVVDVGAGTGTESVAIAKAVGPEGRVIAVEAHPSTAEVLERAGSVNGLNNITVVVAAAANRPGTVRISDSDNFGTNTVLDDGVHEVEAITVDNLVESLGLDHIDFLKMNIEGAERLAIVGMREAVERIDRMAISCHDFLGTEWGATRDLVRSWLVEHDFEVSSRLEDARPWARDYLYASRKRT